MIACVSMELDSNRWNSRYSEESGWIADALQFGESAARDESGADAMGNYSLAFKDSVCGVGFRSQARKSEYRYTRGAKQAFPISGFRPKRRHCRGCEHYTWMAFNILGNALEIADNSITRKWRLLRILRADSTSKSQSASRHESLPDETRLGRVYEYM